MGFILKEKNVKKNFRFKHIQEYFICDQGRHLYFRVMKHLYSSAISYHPLPTNNFSQEKYTFVWNLINHNLIQILGNE